MEVSINNFAVDPNQGLTELPTDVSDPANQIAQGCSVGSSATSSTGDFAITGRGGRLVRPTDLGATHTALDDLGPENEQANSTVTPSDTSANALSPPLADAQAAVVTTSGEVFLLAEGTWQSSLSCASLR